MSSYSSWLPPSYLLARLFRKTLSKLPFFNYVLKIYTKLPGVLAGKTNLVQAQQNELESKYLTIYNIYMLKFYQK